MTITAETFSAKKTRLQTAAAAMPLHWQLAMATRQMAARLMESAGTAVQRNVKETQQTCALLSATLAARAAGTGRKSGTLPKVLLWCRDQTPSPCWRFCPPACDSRTATYKAIEI